ncbi:GntR family transcriptional regulator [Paenibacillaceae bacterium GAS479]|nr:GntR family transcriptional regulator [Paenibacillaceae bacterium GAS479]
MATALQLGSNSFLNVRYGADRPQGERPAPSLPEVLPLSISHTSSMPLYVQLRDQLRRLIRSGTLPPDFHLPSLRDLSRQLNCSLITVRRVYLDLEREGLLSIQKGIGTFVRSDDEGQSARRSWSRALVFEAFRSAVGTGIRHGMASEEMEELLRELLASIPDKEDA